MPRIDFSVFAKRVSILFRVEICLVKNTPLPMPSWPSFAMGLTSGQGVLVGASKIGLREKSGFLLIETDWGAQGWALLHIPRAFARRWLSCSETLRASATCWVAVSKKHPWGLIRAAVPALSCQTLPFLLQEENKHLTCISHRSRLCVTESQV